jgi:CheY-like chemotaxis protein
VHILFVENHETFARTVAESFLPDQDVLFVGTLAEARRVLAARQDFDAVLVDYDLPDGKGTELLAHLQAGRFRGLLSQCRRTKMAIGRWLQAVHTRRARSETFVTSVRC